MENKLEKKYGLLTAIAMVVGVVIGSGVFFKADDVLTKTDGNIIHALLAWTVGAVAMIFGALCFAEYAQRIEKSNGLVDYSEQAYGKAVGYLFGWFKGIMYFTPLSAILAYVASLYTLILFGVENVENSLLTWVIAIIYLLCAYLVNFYSPKIAGKLQVACTFIKLIPLFLVGIVGTIAGMVNGVSAASFAEASSSLASSGGGLAGAIVAAAFAYEGWIVAITINSEIKDSKRNLPLALIIGSLLIFVVYVLYFLGVTGVLPTQEIVALGNNAAPVASENLFGTFASTILTVFVIISCLGTLNGLVLSAVRIPFSLAIRGQGPMPRLLQRVDKKTNMPTYSALFAACLSFAYLALWYCSVNETFGRYIGLDEIPIVMVYGLYILLYAYYMYAFKDLGLIKRFFIPSMAIIGSLIIIYGGATNPSIGFNLIISLLVVLSGLFFYRKEEKAAEYLDVTAEGA